MIDTSRTPPAAAALLAAALSACGGAASSGSAVTGYALTDGPISGEVSLVDASPDVQERRVSTRADGSFSVDVGGLTPPYLLKVDFADEGVPATLYAATDGRDNLDVNPVTDLAYVALTEGADPAVQFYAAASDDKQDTTAKARAWLARLRTVLGPLFDAFGIDDPLTDKAEVRALLKKVKIKKGHGSVTISNKATHGVIYTAPLDDLLSGTLDATQLPDAPDSVTPVCSSFGYSDWGACQPGGMQARTVTSSSPSGCKGGSPVTTRSCAYTPPACASFGYSAWGACQPGGTQTRTVTSSSPAGCAGGAPVTTQSCAYAPPIDTCTSFTYSAWGACEPGGTQRRAVTSSSPSGCTGGAPVTTQPCEDVPADACTTPPAPSTLVGWATEGGGTTGGGSATPVTVTTLSALNAAVGGATPAVVHVKGVLEAGTVTIGSNKTIVGLCGAELRGHVEMKGSANVILRNLRIAGYGCTDAGAVSAKACSGGKDAITVQGAAHHLWFDHLDVLDGSDGNLDMTHAVDYVTVSWSRFRYSSARADLSGGADSTGASGHRFSNLIGHSDGNASEDTGHLRVTFHHNWWGEHVVERQPRIRFGKVHLFNNLHSSTESNYGVGVGVGASVLVEGEVFLGGKTPVNIKSYVNASIAPSAVALKDDLFTGTGGTAPAELNPSTVFSPPYAYASALTAASSTEADVKAGAGPH